ncbi:DNA-3-methyladenine glycosylase I [Sulfobacillus thermotolerans]|uniref:DNA-3-methyladenine glycosylase I n=1 Tax=Sulfobacillus thermotolerans TaxID=338644 RepID=UPI003D2FD28B
MAGCGWEGTDPLYRQYHDTEWGVPVLDDTRLFEFIVLESAQAGLSWLTSSGVVMRETLEYPTTTTLF